MERCRRARPGCRHGADQTPRHREHRSSIGEHPARQNLGPCSTIAHGPLRRNAFGGFPKPGVAGSIPAGGTICFLPAHGTLGGDDCPHLYSVCTPLGASPRWLVICVSAPATSEHAPVSCSRRYNQNARVRLPWCPSGFSWPGTSTTVRVEGESGMSRSVGHEAGGLCTAAVRALVFCMLRRRTQGIR